jgi:hypothetical protein
MIEEQELVADLQHQIDELKKDVKRGLTGPRGAPGDISVAVTQATRAAGQVATDAAKRATRPLENEVAKLREEFVALKADFRRFEENVEHQIAYHLVALLAEYHVTDKDGQPYAGPYSAAAIASLKK